MYAMTAGLSEDLAECVMSRFAEANFARINNKAGFLMGIIRRVKEDGPDGGGADLKILPRSVEHAIRALMDEVQPPAFDEVHTDLTLSTARTRGLYKAPISLCK